MTHPTRHPKRSSALITDAYMARICRVRGARAAAVVMAVAALLYDYLPRDDFTAREIREAAKISNRDIGTLIDSLLGNFLVRTNTGKRGRFRWEIQPPADNEKARHRHLRSGPGRLPLQPDHSELTAYAWLVGCLRWAGHSNAKVARLTKTSERAVRYHYSAWREEYEAENVEAPPGTQLTSGASKLDSSLKLDDSIVPPTNDTLEVV